MMYQWFLHSNHSCTTVCVLTKIVQSLMKPSFSVYCCSTWKSPKNKTKLSRPILCLFVSLCLSIRLSVSLAISSLSVYIFLFSSACLCPYVYLSILFIHLSVFIYLYLSVCVHVLVFSFMLHCYSVLKRVKTPLKSSPWQSRPHWKQHKATSMSHKMLRHESGQ